MFAFLFACKPEDALDMTILMEGMKAHSDAEAFPAWCEEARPVPRMVLDLLPTLGHLEDTWVITLPDQAAMEMLAQLLESVAWKGPVYISDADLERHWTLEQFHKAVMVDKEFV